MSLRVIQEECATYLNQMSALLQGSLEALAENKGDIISQVAAAVDKFGITAIVSVPGATAKSEASRTIVADVTLIIQVVESPMINRSRANSITASDAAELIATELHLQKLPSGFLPVFKKISPETLEDGYIIYNIEFSGTAALGD